MSFTSLYFIIFFMAVFILLWIVKCMDAIIVKVDCVFLGKIVLLLSSYLLVVIVDYRFCACLFMVTVLTYFVGIGIDRRRMGHQGYKGLLVAGIVVSLALLVIFKYYNFFMSSICGWFGMDFAAVHMMLPVGISFYVFSSISYMVDVYRDKYPVQDHFLDMALWLSFFPKLTAGPIIRADKFFIQISKETWGGINKKNFESGIQIFAMGMFKKIVLADRLGVFVDDVYRSPAAFHSITCILAVVSYSLQIYFDFSGYSDMATGVAKIYGLDFGRNFNLPYVSRNLTEFWKRWHISLSSWLQEYLYYPLGGNRKGACRTYWNLFLTMLLGGLWHGASWTFVAWGAIHGCGLIMHKLFVKWKDKYFGWKGGNSLLWDILSVILTFLSVTFCWIFFRAKDFAAALLMIGRIFSWKDGIVQVYTWSIFATAVFIIAVFIAEIKRKKDGRKTVDGFYPIMDLSKFGSLVILFVFFGLIIGMGYFGNTVFIYGKF